jgi:hypothetical protein
MREVGLVDELAAFGRRMEKITDPAAIARIVRAGGMAGKKAALDAARHDLGGDRAMSGFRRKAALGAGFDAAGGTAVAINFRPAGLWRLASQGRQSSGFIRPRKRGGKRAVTPAAGVARAWSRYGRSRGLDTFDDAVRQARVDVPRAAFEQFQAEVGRAMRG